MSDTETPREPREPSPLDGLAQYLIATMPGALRDAASACEQVRDDLLQDREEAAR